MPALGRSSSLTCAILVSLLTAVAGCTTSVPDDVPDVVILLDGGRSDTSVDGGPTCIDPGWTVGTSCDEAADCDDGCYCNGSEGCDDGTCVTADGPCAGDGVDCTDDSCVEETRSCRHAPDHAACSDGFACNGDEVCDRTLGCVAGTPLYCNDEDSCTVDSCDDATGCVFTPRDLDGDGYISRACGGEDCDDDARTGATIHPGMAEDCHNRRDDDCDGSRDYADSECIPDNDTCETARAIPAVTGIYSASTRTLRTRVPLGCAPGTGPDAIFRFSLEEDAADVRLGVTGITEATIALRRFDQCASGPDIRCRGAYVATSILARSLPRGEYAIIVRTTTGGAFDLHLTVSPPTVAPAIDRCDSSTTTITASGTYGGRFEETTDAYSLSCQTGSPLLDGVYRLELADESDVEITTTTSPSGPSYVALTTDCSSPAGTVMCTDSTAIRRRGMAAGVYYIVVESEGDAAVEWSMDVAITSPPVPRQPGDACSTVVEVPLAGTDALMTGSGMALLAGAELDTGTSCGGGSAGARDVFFSFTLTEPRDVTLRSTSTGGIPHQIALQSRCGDTSSDVRCRDSGGDSPFSQVFRNLPADQYFAVMSTTTASGAATLAVESRPATPAPPNDRCAGAVDVPDGVLRRETLTGFDDDVMGAAVGYADAFYEFTLDGPRLVTIIATPLAVSSIHLFLRSGCGSTTNLGNANAFGGSPAALARVLGAGRYVFFVEMPPSTAGDFTLRVLSDPVP